MSQEELEDLRGFFEALGFLVRSAPYFADCGLFIGTQPVEIWSAAEREHFNFDPRIDLRVFERTIFIYPNGPRWEARVTLHGGPHWIRSAESPEEIREVALRRLRTERWTPDELWSKA